MGFVDNALASVRSFFEQNSVPIFTVVVTLIIGYIAIKIIVHSVKVFFEKADFDRTIEIFIERSIGFVLWVLLILVIMGNLGINIGPLIAGLGIMGFVIGFALQDTISNLASGIFIMFYKPFRLGDWVNIDGLVGKVKDIGMAACTLNSPDNIKMTIPNSKIWKSSIQNYTGYPTRKLFNLNIMIAYDDDIGKAIKIINKTLNSCKTILKDPEPQVVVKELGDNGVKIGVRPSVKSEDFWTTFFYLNKELKEQFDKAKITIPFPQRTIHIKKK